MKQNLPMAVKVDNRLILKHDELNILADICYITITLYYFFFGWGGVGCGGGVGE